MTVWPIHDRARNDCWSKGAVVLMGDACHAMRPFMAAGGSMAIEDAAILSRCISQFDDPADLSRYEATRIERVADVQRISIDNTWMRGPTETDWFYCYDPCLGPLDAAARSRRTNPLTSNPGAEARSDEGARSGWLWRNPAESRWPGGARIAVNFNLNVEGGGEASLANGDVVSEGMLNDIGVAAYRGLRVPLVESVFEYGSRRGAWRVLDILRDHSLFRSASWAWRARWSKIRRWPAPASSAATRWSATAIAGSIIAMCPRTTSASTSGKPSTRSPNSPAAARSAG